MGFDVYLGSGPIRHSLFAFTVLIVLIVDDDQHILSRIYVGKLLDASATSLPDGDTYSDYLGGIFLIVQTPSQSQRTTRRAETVVYV